MITIKLHIPDELADKIHRLTGNAESYVIDMLRSKLKESEKPKLLAEEYRLAAVENVSVIKDFTYTDSEGWDDEY